MSKVIALALVIASAEGFGYFTDGNTGDCPITREFCENDSSLPDNCDCGDCGYSACGDCDCDHYGDNYDGSGTCCDAPGSDVDCPIEETVCASTMICSTITMYCLKGGNSADLFDLENANDDEITDDYRFQIDRTGTDEDGNPYYSFKVVGSEMTFLGIDGHEGQGECSNNMFSGDRQQCDQ